MPNNPESKLQRQIDLQKLLINMASRYINIKLDHVEAAIQESLEQMGTFVGADRVYIFDFHFEKQIAINTYEWCAEGVAPQIEYLQALPAENLQPWVEVHQNGMPFLIEDVAQLPDDGPEGIKTLLASQGIQTIITVPLLNGDELLGAVGFDFVKQLTPITDQEQAILRLFADMLVNIRLRQKAELERKQIIEITNHQNERLKNFAYIVSHNIRSHAANIDGLLHLMLDDQPTLSQDQTFNMLVNVSKNLDQTLRHLNKVVLIHTSTHEAQSLALREYIAKAIENVTGLAKKANVNIELQCPSSYFILGNPDYLDSIILNLLTNAIKYRDLSRPGLIRIETSEKTQYIIMSISDNGIGIDLKKHSKDIFGMYKTFHDHVDSSGLGLFITKNQVMSMGGHIEVNSQPGEGTTFTVYLLKAD